MKSPNFAPMYVMMYPVLAEMVRAHGYALAVHGTMASDFDLVAIPWVENPKPPEQLIEAIGTYFKLLEGTFGTSVDKEPELKPHGRKAWNLHFGGEVKIDLSIMPILPFKASLFDMRDLGTDE